MQKPLLPGFFGLFILISISSAHDLPYYMNESDYNESQIHVPSKDLNETSLETHSICRPRDHLRWDFCSTQLTDGAELIKNFNFTNYGENKIVPKADIGIGRYFEFSFEDHARSDINLLVWDSPDQVESHAHLKMMYFFPRKIVQCF